MKLQPNLGLDLEDQEIFLSLLREIPYPVYAYGSRVKGKNKKFSDIDLCIDGEISTQTLSLIKEKFEDSNLPV